MTYENFVICTYLVLGFCFGLVTFSHRYLFSEGPHKAESPAPTSWLEGRVFWVMICTWLWPILLLTGINSAWILAKRRVSTKN